MNSDSSSHIQAAPAPLTYSQAGVDISNADQTKLEMKAALETANPLVLNRLGAFSSLVSARFEGIADPVLVLKMEEPGSKQLLAAQAGRLADIGYDLINHLINDVVVMGAKPLVVLDTIICGKLEKEAVLGLVRTMAKACRDQGCELVGGETSEQPRVIPNGSYILSAAAVGVVDRNRVIDGSKIRAGDQILAFASNGIHTNGYTLVRSLLDRNSTLASTIIEKETFLDWVLRPHRCYNRLLQELFADSNSPISGLAHITGGGIEGNLVRILPTGLDANIECGTIRVLPIFTAIKSAGTITDSEMLRTFNMGVGMICVAPPEAVAQISALAGKHAIDCYKIGEVCDGSGKVNLVGGLNY